MSERVTDQVGALVRRLAKHLNRKISDTIILLFNHKSAGSIGAIAGFAIAVVFTWKFLRSPPGGPRRNPPKRRSAPPAGVGQTSRADVVAPEDTKSADGAGTPIELNLGQIVRRKLGGCRKMTCQLLGVILEEWTPEGLQGHATVRDSVVEILQEITKYCDIYLMETVLDDESEERVLLALESAGVFEVGGLVKEKVLFCSTETGRTSFVRQLEADWHIDTNIEVVSQLSRFIRHQLYVCPAPMEQIAANVFASTSLEKFFSSL